MIRLTLSFLAAFTVCAWADNSVADMQARAKLLSPPPGQPYATYPMPREGWVYRFTTNLDKLKQGPYDLVLDGDSITDFFQWTGKGADVLKQHFGNLKILDLAIENDEVENVLWRAQHGELEGQHPKLIMLMIGTVNLGQDPQSVAAGIKLIVNAYEKCCPDSHILLLAIFPRQHDPTDPARKWVLSVNAILATFPPDPKVTYLDIGDTFLLPDGKLNAELMPDFLDPSPKGYAVWADAIQPVIDKYFPKVTAK